MGPGQVFGDAGYGRHGGLDSVDEQVHRHERMRSLYHARLSSAHNFPILPSFFAHTLFFFFFISRNVWKSLVPVASKDGRECMCVQERFKGIEWISTSI